MATPQELEKYGLKVLRDPTTGKHTVYESGGYGMTAGSRSLADTSVQGAIDLTPEYNSAEGLQKLGISMGAIQTSKGAGQNLSLEDVLNQYRQNERSLTPLTPEQQAAQAPARPPEGMTQWQYNMQQNQVKPTATQTGTQPMQPPTNLSTGQFDAGWKPSVAGEVAPFSQSGQVQNAVIQAPTSPSREFPGLTSAQVAQLDAAVARNYSGKDDKANVDYAMKRFGYKPPSSPATPTTPQSGTTSPGTQSPVEAPKSYLDVLKEQVNALDRPSDEEINTQKMIDNLLTSEAMGLNDIRDQAIAMPFITGQSKSVEARAQTQLDTLERKLARLQADREAKRQAAVDVAGIEEKKAAQEQARLDKEEAKKATAEKAIQQEVFDLIEKGFTPITGPSGLAGLSENQILRLPGTDIVLKKPEVADKLLTPTEAARLGVPYGTTQKEAAAMNKTPAFGKKTTSSGEKKSSTSQTTQTSSSGLNKLLAKYPTNFQEYVRSIASKVSYKLDKATIDGLYKQAQSTATKSQKEGRYNYYTALNIPDDIKNDLKEDINAGASLEDLRDAYPEVNLNYLSSLLRGKVSL